MAKNKSSLEKDKKKKVPFNVLSKKGLMCLAMAGVMLATPFMLAGCSNGQDGKDGAPGTIWKSGTSYAEFTDAKVGDYFIDTDDYILYQKTADSWTIVMENYGRPGNNGTNGTDGITPTITINEDGYWVINGVPTTTKAEGQDGTNGTNGTDGTTPTISINDDGYWVINNQVTNVKAEAIDGTDGKDGNTWSVGTEYPTTAKSGDMFLNNSTWDVYQYNGTEWESKGNIKGEKGDDGKDGTSVYVGYDGYIWQGTTRTEYKVVDFELGADVIENTVGIETMSAFEGGYIDTSIAQIALMGYYQQETNLTVYGNSLVKTLTVYAETSGTLEIGTAKVEDVVSARTNGSSILTLSNSNSYELNEGKNIITVELSVADDETIVLGGSNSTANLYYAQGIDLDDEQGLFTTISSSANDDIYSQIDGVKNKLYIQVEATYDLTSTYQAFTNIETFMSGLSSQTTLASAQGASSALYPLFYNENDNYKNSQIMEVTIPVITVSSLTEDQTITMYVADNSVLSSTDVQTFIASENCKTYTLTIPSSTFEGLTNTKIAQFITLDVSELNIFVDENEVIGFGSTTDNISSWGIISHKQTTNPEFYLSYSNSNTTVTNGNGIYSLLFNFTIQKGSKTTFEDRIEDITSRNNEVVVANVLQDKNLSILGDSISTYKGYSNDATNTNDTIGSNAVYGNYQSSGSYGIDVEDTWWMQTVVNNEMNLLVNNSWSGSSTVGDPTSTEAGCGTRAENLHDNTGENAGTNPDIIAVYMGTNDLGKTVGDYTADGFYDSLIIDGNYITPTTFSEAYAIMLDRMTKAYPDADIFCFTILANNSVSSTNNENINNAIKAIAEHYGATVVDIYTETGITSENAGDYMLDAETSHIHPNEAGMDLITEVFEQALLEKYSK